MSHYAVAPTSNRPTRAAAACAAIAALLATLASGAAELTAQTQSSRHAEAPSAASKGRRPLDASLALTASTLGLGVEAAKLVGSHAALRVSAQGASYNGTAPDEEGVSSGYNLKLRTVSALVDLFPFRRGAFRLSGGLVSGTTSLGYTETGEFAVGDGETVDGSGGNSYTGTRVESLGYPSTRPYAGFGWGTPASSRGGLGFVADFGVVFGRPAYVNRVTGPATNDPALQAELEADQEQVQETLDQYGRFYPKVGFGLSYRF